MIEAAPLMRLFLGLAALVALGYGLAAWLLPGLGRLERAAFGLGPGALILTLWMLALSALRLPFHLPLVLGPPLALVVGLRLGTWLRGKSPGPRLRPLSAWLPSPPLRSWDWVLIGLLAVLLLFAVLRAGLYPMWSWDAISTWGFKAKVFFLRGGLDFQGFEAHNYYPNLVPLLLTYLYLCLGQVNDHLVKLVFPLWGGGLLVMLYALGRRFGLSRRLALGMVCFLALNGLTFIQHLHIAYADLALTYFTLGAAGLIYLWLTEPVPSRTLALAALFFAGLPWCKFEGGPLAGTILLAAGLTLLWLRPPRWRRRLLELAWPALGLVVGYLPWRLYALSQGIETGSDHVMGFYPQQFFQALPAFLRGLANPFLFGLLWPACLLSLILLGRRLFTTTLLFPVLFLGGNLLAILLAYTVAPTSPFEFHLYLRATLDRLLLHLAPVAALVVGLGMQGLLEAERPGETAAAAPLRPITE